MSDSYILVVEDDEFTQTIYQHMLDGEGFPVRFASDYQEAVGHINAKLPVLILMDYMLPSVDGIALTKTFKSDPNTAKIPVIMITGEGVMDVIKRSKAAGADDFIVKPVEKDILVKKIKRLL